MQTLTTGVGDLKRVLTNVKIRGVWAEFLLESLLEQMLSPEQYEKNVEVNPGSGKVVEFAIKLPGHDSSSPVWMPIDSKFPKEAYERLVVASEHGDNLPSNKLARTLKRVSKRAPKTFLRNISHRHIARTLVSCTYQLRGCSPRSYADRASSIPCNRPTA